VVETDKWTESLGGVVHPDYNPNPVIIFAVQNASKSDILVPHELTPGFITATATTGRKRYSYALVSRSPDGGPLFCRKLSPGEIAYLHPLYSFIDLKWRRTCPLGVTQWL